MGTDFHVSNQQYIIIDKLVRLLKEKVGHGLKGKCPLPPESLINSLQLLVEGKFEPHAHNNILRLISAGEYLTIGSCGATTQNIDKSLLAALSAENIPPLRKKTKRTFVQVHEMHDKDAKTFEIFSSLSKNFDSLCLTPAQITRFIEKYGSWLKIGDGATYFLSEDMRNGFTVYAIAANGGGKSVACRTLAPGGPVHEAFMRCRVVTRSNIS